MNTIVNGNIIQFTFDDADIPASGFAYIPYTLPDGYSLGQALFRRNINAGFFTDDTSLIELFSTANVPLSFPTVDGKSPNHVVIRISNAVTTYDVISITIFKFGGKPDPNYFDRAFTPILITDKDGVDYNMIPGTQFY